MRTPISICYNPRPSPTSKVGLHKLRQSPCPLHGQLPHIFRRILTPYKLVSGIQPAFKCQMGGIFAARIDVFVVHLDAVPPIKDIFVALLEA